MAPAPPLPPGPFRSAYGTCRGLRANHHVVSRCTFVPPTPSRTTGALPNSGGSGSQQYIRGGAYSPAGSAPGHSGAIFSSQPNTWGQVSVRLWRFGWHTQLNKRGQPPECALPLCVGVLCLPLEQRVGNVSSANAARSRSTAGTQRGALSTSVRTSRRTAGSALPSSHATPGSSRIPILDRPSLVCQRTCGIARHATWGSPEVSICPHSRLT